MAVFSQIYPDIVLNLKKLNNDFLSTFQNLMAWSRVDRVFVACSILQVKSKFSNFLSNLSCVCPVIGHEFRQNIFKEVVDPRGDRLNLHDPKFNYHLT